MADSVVRDFPLFPLGIVALPHELVPLHIFEQRYRTMIGECLERGSEFGIVWARRRGPARGGLRDGDHRSARAMDDGRMNILTRGTRPFRIVDERHDLAYPAGTVEFLTDKAERADPKTRTAAHEAYGELVAEATDHEPDADELAPLTAYQMAATVDFGLDAKQGLLDLRSENARLRLVTRLFRAAMKRLDFIERARERARSNGRVRFS